jgi:hypothetical protein
MLSAAQNDQASHRFSSSKRPAIQSLFDSEACDVAISSCQVDPMAHPAARKARFVWSKFSVRAGAST